MKKILALEQQMKEYKAVCIALAGAGLQNTDVYKLALNRLTELNFKLNNLNGVTNEVSN